MEMDGFRWESHDNSRTRFMVPTSWVTTRIDEKTIRIAPQGDVAIEFRYFTEGAPEALQDEALIGEELKEFATDLVIKNPPTKFTQHGLAGFGIGGIGKRGDMTIAWFSITVGDQHGHGVLAFGFGDVEPFKTEYPTILRIMQSIQPI